MDYLTRVRINKAVQFMSDPAVKVYEVAEAVGYQSHYFSLTEVSLKGTSASTSTYGASVPGGGGRRARGSGPWRVAPRGAGRLTAEAVFRAKKHARRVRGVGGSPRGGHAGRFFIPRLAVVGHRAVEEGCARRAPGAAPLP
ncbi:MAG: hypothetical protein ABSG63_16560 [Spirochaetia bacterium]